MQHLPNLCVFCHSGAMQQKWNCLAIHGGSAKPVVTPKSPAFLWNDTKAWHGKVDKVTIHFICWLPHARNSHRSHIHILLSITTNISAKPTRRPYAWRGDNKKKTLGIVCSRQKNDRRDYWQNKIHLWHWFSFGFCHLSVHKARPIITCLAYRNRLSGSLGKLGCDSFLPIRCNSHSR